MFCIASQEEEKFGEGGSGLVLGLVDVEPVEPELVVVELPIGIVGRVIVRLGLVGTVIVRLGLVGTVIVRLGLVGTVIVRLGIVGRVIERLGTVGLEEVLKSPDVLGHNITLYPGWRKTQLYLM